MTPTRNPELLIRAYLDEGPAELPDRTFEAVRREIHRTRRRVVIGRWREPRMATLNRLAIAAAFAAALGIIWLNLPSSRGPGAVPTPGPSPSPLPTLPLVNVPVPPGTYRLLYTTSPGMVPGTELDPHPAIVITVPSGWTSFQGWAVDKNYGTSDADAGPSFVLWNITHRFVNPCSDHTLASPAPDQTVDGLLNALASMPGVTAAAPKDVSVDGYAGKSIELTIATDIAGCREGFWTWGDPGGGYRYAQVTGEVDRVYAIDVGGVRRTFFARIPPQSTAADRAQLEAIIASIDIQPPGLP